MSDTNPEPGEPHGTIFPILLESVELAVAGGMSRELAVEAASEAFIESMPTWVGHVTAGMHQTKAELLIELASDRESLAAAIEERWGRALAMYEAVAYAVYELGAALHLARHSPDSDDAVEEAAGSVRDDEAEVSVDIMSLLHGRACTVAYEVLCLLRAGFADGAAARQRTLHELAVVINLIAENQQLDLAARYVDYSVVEQREDMRNYQRYAVALQYVPFSQAEVDRLEAQYQEVLQRRGNGFRRRNQWAAPLFPAGSDITFIMLEQKAQLDHLRPYYRYANHAIHAGPRAAVLNLYADDYPWTIGAGARADTDIAGIAHAALISLLQCTTPLVTNAPDVLENLDFLLQVQVLERLVKDAGLTFYRAARTAGFVTG